MEPDPPPTEEEANQFLESLQKQADQWRERLSQSPMAELVASGKMRVSPLVRDLLAAFPPKSKK